MCDKIKEAVMGKKWRPWRQTRNAFKILVGEFEGVSVYGRIMYIEKDLQELDSGYVNWINVVQKCTSAEL
jgi:hypothetical protein